MPGRGMWRWHSQWGPAWHGGGWSRGWRGGGWGYGGVYPVTTTIQPGEQSLERLPEGSKVRVKYILAGIGASSRLASMGIVPGVIVEVVKNDLTYPWTPLIIKVNGVEVAIGRGLASRIIVEPITSSQQEEQQ